MGPHSEQQPAAPSRDGGAAPPVVGRRGFLRAGSGTGTVLLLGGVLGGGAASAAARREPRGTLDTAQVAMILEVARAGAVYPVPFPPFGETGPPGRRATPARLRARLPTLADARVARARRGAQELIDAGLAGRSRSRLLDGLGKEMDGKAPSPDLLAAVALAVATISRRFDPADDAAAGFWLGCVRRRHQRLHP